MRNIPKADARFDLFGRQQLDGVLNGCLDGSDREIRHCPIDASVDQKLVSPHSGDRGTVLRFCKISSFVPPQKKSNTVIMVGVAAAADSKSIVIIGHGLKIADSFELSAGIRISPDFPKLDLSATVEGCSHFSDYAAALHGSEIATFAIHIEHQEGGQSLAAKGWNSLWLFHLLSVACQSPCFPLYSVSDGKQPLFSAASPNPFLRPLTNLHAAKEDELRWAQRYSVAFDKLIKVPEFGAAMRCFGGAHLLPQQDVQIMLLWAGIEGLLSVDAELSRRLALYTALLLNASPDEKVTYFNQVKKAYAIRSRAVHGSGVKKAKLDEGVSSASKILSGLLARCVELGRVPSPAELDRLAVSPIIE